MKKAKFYKEQRATKLEAQERLVNLMKDEERNLTEEESVEFDGLTRDINDLATQIVRAEQIEETEARMATARQTASNPTEAGSEFEGFSLTRYISNMMSHRAQEGPELAVNELANRMAKEAGINITGTALPVAAIGRAISVGGNGSNWVEKLDGGFIDALRDMMVLPTLGAQTMGGLQGDVILPRLVGGAATWNAETGTVADSGQDTEQVLMQPKRVAAIATVSSQFLAQSSPDASRVLANDLLAAIAIAVDYAGIYGGGTNEPNGILSTTGIGAVALGTNGAAPTWKSMVDLEAAVAVENAATGSLHYLTNPKMRAKLKTTALDAGSGRFCWEGKAVNGYDSAVSNGVPSDLTKGTGTALSAMIFGNFNEVVIGQWGSVVDLIIDPYTSAASGQVRLIANGFFDVGVRQPKAFAAIKDAITV